MPDLPLDADLSPALGGHRAAPAEPLPPPPGAEPGPTSDPGDPDLAALRDELGAILGPEGAEVLEALTQIGTLGVGLSSLFADTLQTLDRHMPQTLAAFEGLVEAMGQAVSEALDPLLDPDDPA